MTNKESKYSSQRRSCKQILFYFLNIIHITTQPSAIPKCYRDALVYKSYSPDLRDHACLVKVFFVLYVVSGTPFLQHHHIVNQWDVLFYVLCITRATTNDSVLINGYKMSGNSLFPRAQGKISTLLLLSSLYDKEKQNLIFDKMEAANV